MTRPAPQAAATHSVQPWATNANHPAGTDLWSNQPTKVPHPGPVGGFLPGQGAAAEYFNWLFNAQGVRDQAVKDYLNALASKFNELLIWTGQEPALNILRKTSVGNVGFAFFAKREWLAVGAVENVRSTSDLGLTWSTSSDVNIIGSDEDCTTGDSDRANDISVVATKTRYVFRKVGAAFTKVDALGATYTGSEPPQVVFDPVRGKFVWMGASGTIVRTSPDGLTWTTSTSPAGWTVGFIPVRMGVNKTSGRVLAIGNSGSAFKVMSSDDGGGTWTARADVPVSTPAAMLVSEISHDPVNGWLLSVGETTGTYSGEVWRSTDDGASWTKVSTLTSCYLSRIGAVGSLWVAVAVTDLFGAAQIVYSIDGGATWKLQGTTVSPTNASVAAAFGQIVVVGGTTVHMMARAGEPGLGTVS